MFKFSKILAVGLSVLCAGQLMASSIEQGVSRDSMVEAEGNPRLRSFEVSIDPVLAIIREFSTSFQFRISDKMSIGPVLRAISEGEDLRYSGHVADRTFYDDTTNSLALGVMSNTYFSGFSNSGMYLSASLLYRQTELKFEETRIGFSVFDNEKDEYAKAKFEETQLDVFLGYQWVIAKSRLRLSIAGGLSAYDTPDSITVEYKDNEKWSYDTTDAERVTAMIQGGVSFLF